MIVRLIKQIYEKLLVACTIFAGVLIIAGIVMIVVDVILRSTGFKPPGFTVAFVEYILLYFVLLSAPYLVREKGHVLTDMVVQNLPPPLKFFIEKFVYLLCIAISILFAIVGGMLCLQAFQLGYMDERSVDIPYWLLYILYPLCFSMIAIEFTRYLIGKDSLFDRDLSLDSV